MEGLYEEFNAASTATRAATIEQLNFQRAFIETQRLVSQKAFSESLSGIDGSAFWISCPVAAQPRVALLMILALRWMLRSDLPPS